jgi:phage terminase small subunit
MPDKRGRFSPQESKFIQAYAATNNAIYSAEKAGYSQPDAQAYQALARPKVKAEIARLQAERITNEILPLAVDQHKALLSSNTTPAGAKVQAIKLAYDHALGAGATEGKSPHDMTGDELNRALDRLKGEAAIRATPVIEGTAELVTESVFD